MLPFARVEGFVTATSMTSAQAEVLEAFGRDGFALRQQLASFLRLSAEQLDERLPNSTEAMAAAHPGALAPEQAEQFYEDEVGDGHLYELAAWHLSSRDYIGDTSLQEIAHGHHLDFGGGITHALAAAQLPQVEKVWMVISMANRPFVSTVPSSLAWVTNSPA